jgi:Arc/MetJ-type ribon-helix-helix transcriptional regulator
MSTRKERLTVTVDPDFIEAGNDAVAEGRAESLSAWVNTALRETVAKERRLAALATAITDYEKRYGTITKDELAEQTRADRRAATVVRGGAKPATGKRRLRRKA